MLRTREVELFFLATRALVLEDSYTSAATTRWLYHAGVHPDQIHLAEEQNPCTPKSSHNPIWKS